MLKRLSAKTIFVGVAVALILWFLLSGTPMTTSNYASDKKVASPMPTASTKSGYAPAASQVVGASVDDEEYAPANLAGTNINTNIGCSMNAGTGLASSLMPKEVASQEDYGQFAPNDILKGQNFLDPREQVGWPETIGGTIRNGNHDLRVNPPNSKDQYTWNNSTIVPDLMQRNLFCN